jgi:hypothetical protein
MTSGTPFQLRPCAASSAGAFYHVYIGVADHPVATVAVTRERPVMLEVRHPAYLYRMDGTITDHIAQQLVAWLCDLKAVNAALLQAGGEPVQLVGWSEAVRITRCGSSNHP